MKKIKNICKEVLSYVASRKILRYSIVVIIMLLSIGSVAINKYFNNKNKIENLKLQSSKKEEQSNNITNGKINTDVVFDKSISRHTLSDGFSTLTDDNTNETGSNGGSNNSFNNIASNASNNIDKSFIKGINLEILEGNEFDPKKDLKLEATDRDGRNISDDIIIEKNSVNTSIPGTYTVKVSVRLNNGKIKEKEFTVKVKETKLDVYLQKFNPIKYTVKKGEKIGFELDLKVSKNHIYPTEVMINGKEYNLYKGNDNIIDKLTKIKNYKVFLDTTNNSGLYEYNLEHIKMSNGSWISLGNNIKTVEVLKDEASIKNFNYEEQSLNKNVQIKFDLYDIENTASNLRLELYKDNEILSSINLDKKNNYCVNLPITKNGIYKLKILSDIALSQNSNEDNIIIDKAIFNTTINIANIDQTQITGNDIEITQGEELDIINDLNLKATDFDGEDITNKIEVDSDNFDNNELGKQSIVISVINKKGQKYTKEFYITVNSSTKNEFNLTKMIMRNFNRERSIQSKSSSNIIINENDTNTITHSVKVNGTVSKSDGSLPAGKIQVEVPTAMAFIVDESGNFTSGNYAINNKSSIGISVSVSEFRGSNINSSIKINAVEKDISKLDRSNLHLALVGNNGNYADLGKRIDIPIEILRLEPSSSSIIQLLGESGTGSGENVDKNGANEEFTLVFKIQKLI